MDIVAQWVRSSRGIAGSLFLGSGHLVLLVDFADVGESVAECALVEALAIVYSYSLSTSALCYVFHFFLLMCCETEEVADVGDVAGVDLTGVFGVLGDHGGGVDPGEGGQVLDCHVR